MLRINKFPILFTLLIISIPMVSYSMDPDPVEKPTEKLDFAIALEKLYQQKATCEEKVKLLNDELMTLKPYNQEFIRTAEFHLTSEEWQDKLSDNAKDAIKALVITARKAHEQDDIALLAQEFSRYIEKFTKEDHFLKNTLTMLKGYEFYYSKTCEIASHAALAFNRYDFEFVADVLGMLQSEEKVAEDLSKNLNPRECRKDVSYDLWLRQALLKILVDNGVKMTKK